MPTMQQIISLGCQTLTFWGAPLLAAPVLAGRLRAVVVVPAFLLYACSALWAIHGDAGMAPQLALYVVALLYFAVIGCLLHRYASMLRAGFTRPALIFSMILCFLLLPSFTWPHALGATFLSWAWERALAAYSYVIESDAREERPSRRDCLFFLIVDPTLVYLDGECARPGVTQPKLPSVLRVAWGILLSGPATFLFAERERIAGLLVSDQQGYVDALARGALLFTAFYVSHSACASVRIGVTRLLGYQLPERYRYPFLAQSPMDFWNRWNTYVGAWFRYYVFFPVFAWARELRYVRLLASPLALLLTMVSVGALHDLYVYAISLHVRTAFTLSFAAGALVMLTWSALAAVLRRARVKRPPLPERGHALGWRALTVLGVAQAVWLCFAWFAP